MSVRCPAGDTREQRTCLEGELKSLVARKGSRATLATVQALREDRIVAADQCHSLLHAIGIEVVQQGVQPRDALAVEGGEICAAGYYHGVVEGSSFHLHLPIHEICSAEDLLRTAAVNCYHGLGHSLMAPNYDLPKSLTQCEAFPDPSWRHCASGVFMENSFPAHGVSNWNRPSDPVFPCNAVEVRWRQECYPYVSSRILIHFGGDMKAALAGCTSLGEPDARYCVEGLGNRIGDRVVQGVLSYSSASAVCTERSNPYPEECVEHVAATLVTQDARLERGIAFCRTVPDFFQSACFLRVVRAAGQATNSSQSELERLCRRYFQEGWFDHCLDAVSRDIKA